MYLVYRRVLAVGVTAAAIVGAGGAALAASGSDTTNGRPASSTADPTGQHNKQGKHRKGRMLHRLEHGQIVTKGKDGAVTHTLFLGTVTAVTPTSVTVQAADKASQKFSVSKDTKVRQRSGEKGTKPTESSISKIAKGDHVFVAGVGKSTVAAKRIVELAK